MLDACIAVLISHAVPITDNISSVESGLYDEVRRELYFAMVSTVNPILALF